MAPDLEALWRRTLEPGWVRLLALPVLSVLALLFHTARAGKHGIFRLGLFPRTRLRAYTVSVGNLAMGGTGKTPVTAEVARFLSEELGLSTAVLCRGYGSPNRQAIRIISRKGRLEPDAALGGDEANLLARSLSFASIIVGKRRAVTGPEADRLGCQAVVLDDGFQYWRLERDLDLVCFSASWPVDWHRPFPLGILREPLSRLEQVRYIVLSGTEAVTDREERALQSWLQSRAPAASFLRSRFTATGVHRVGEPGEPEEPASLSGKRILALSNMVHPARFRATLEELEPAALIHRACPDHHVHSRESVKDVLKQADDERADLVVATEKDELSLLDAIPREARQRFRILRGRAKLSGPGLELLLQELRRAFVPGPT